MKRVKHYRITGKVLLLSGMRIGGSDELLDIGATDLTVIRHPVTRLPYLPGSSLKGRMRSQLELEFGLCTDDKPFNGRQTTTPEQYLVAAVFGPHFNPDHGLGPTRLLVRDGKLLSEDLQIETKTEVTSKRGTGIGTNPRKIERVPEGAVFELKLDLQVLDLDVKRKPELVFGSHRSEESLLGLVLAGLKAVELTGIGSGVSRGYGEVQFNDLLLDGHGTWPDGNTPFQLPATVTPPASAQAT